MKWELRHLQTKGCHSRRPVSSTLPATFVTIGLVLAVSLGGCATNSGRPHSHFERLEIVSVVHQEFSGDVPSKSEAAATGLAAGALSGLMVNTLFSLACGPFFAACFSAGATGMAATTVAGGVLGLAQLSPEEAEPLVQALESFHARHSLAEELTDSVAGQLPKAKVDPSGAADARLSLEIKDVGILAGLGSQASFMVAAEATFEWDRHLPQVRRVSQVYVCHTPAQPVEDWLTGSGALIEQELMHCAPDLGGQIVEALRQPPLPPQSATDPAVQMAEGTG